MVVRARDLERLGQFNKLVTFTDPADIGGTDLTAWCRVDDSTLTDSARYGQIGGSVVEVGNDTRRVLFIRTRANDAITVNHQAQIGGLSYDVRSIQELASRGELRIALVRVAQS